MGLMGHGLRPQFEENEGEIQPSYWSKSHIPLDRVFDIGFSTQAKSLEVITAYKQKPQPPSEETGLVTSESLLDLEPQEDGQSLGWPYVVNKKLPVMLTEFSFKGDYGLNPFGDISDLLADFD
jgi:hypothetical protein